MLEQPTSKERIFFYISMDERIQRLKRWLHRTRLSEWQFRSALMKKRRDELVRIVKDGGPAIMKGQLPDARIIRIMNPLWSYKFEEVENRLLMLPLGGTYKLVLDANKHIITYRFAHGWICTRSVSAYQVDPDCWIKFTGWTEEHFDRMLAILPDLVKEWIREDEYVTEEFVKINKIRAIRLKVQKLKEQREKENGRLSS